MCSVTTYACLPMQIEAAGEPSSFTHQAQALSRSICASSTQLTSKARVTQFDPLWQLRSRHISSPSTGSAHSLQEFVLPESLRLDTAFDTFAAEDEFPVLDLHADDGVDTVARLACAAETWGFFKVTNHGVPLQLIQRVMAHMQEFFAIPIEEKMRVKSDMPRTYQGYTPGTMIVDVDGKHPCWTERLFFARRKDAFLELANRVWPEHAHDQIRQDLLQYLEHMDA